MFDGRFEDRCVAGYTSCPIDPVSCIVTKAGRGSKFLRPRCETHVSSVKTDLGCAQVVPDYQTQPVPIIRGSDRRVASGQWRMAAVPLRIYPRSG